MDNDSALPPPPPPPPPPRLTLVGMCIAASIAAAWVALVVAKLPHLGGVADWWWSERARWSPFLTGAVIAGLTGVVLMLLLLPTMILTWTTALLFDYACNRGIAERELLVMDGRIMARDIFLTTFRSVVRESKLVAFAAAASFLLVAFVVNNASSRQPPEDY